MKTGACCSASRENKAIKNSKKTNNSVKVNASNEIKNSNDLVYLDGGEFMMGTDDKTGYPNDGEMPSRNVFVKPFAIDRYAVTNNRFKTFIEETGYVTEAEQFGWSFVFHSLLADEVKNSVTNVVKETPWWFVVEGACWKYPEGRASSIHGRLDHPVVHISWNDAAAFCNWSGKRLPTEAEWEFAARGGLVANTYPWGNELMKDGKHQCNIWQGKFPAENTGEDGFISTAPVHAFHPNEFGLFNTSGNVWEWCSDWFTNIHPKDDIIKDPDGPTQGTGKVMKGGSYLCHKSYCHRYRVAARTVNTPDSSTGNIGFRCAADMN